MRRRLYFLLPDVRAARQMLDTLLLARIEERRIHFLARRGALPADLPEATVFQKTDIVHGAELGMIIGGASGVLGGLVAVFFPPAGISLQLVTVLVTAILGAVFGAWVASLAASAVPNSRLKAFHSEIERGKVLMMVDVPFRRAQEIAEKVHRAHPEASDRGVEPTIPAFP